jgi:2-phosphoglycerate kinase
VASPPRAILIGGTSHTGKSTLAAVLASRLGGEACSTDHLARHPGRPWATAPAGVPAHVAEHYRALSTDEQMASVLDHYRRLAPRIVALVGAATARSPLVLEGSALLPATVAPLMAGDVVGVTLLAGPDLLTARINAESRFVERDLTGRGLIDAFLARAIAFNSWLASQAAAHRLAVHHLRSGVSAVELANTLFPSLS